MKSNRIRAAFDFEHPESRRLAFVLVLAVAIVSPDIPTPGDLPVVRLEQLLLAAYLPSMFLYARKDSSRRGIGGFDYIFAALACAMTITIIFAPLIVDNVTRSMRDPFEVARVVEYWLMFRLGLMAVDAAGTRTQALRVLGLAAIGGTAFSLVQYFDPGSFNDVVTDIWANEHNLDAVDQQGRVVGTLGNANYFGIFCGLLVLAGLSAILLLWRDVGRWRWLAGAGAAAATLGLVMSQSRTASFALLGAMSLGLAAVLVKRKGNANYAAAIGLFVATAAISIAFVELVPPDSGTYHERFNPNNVGDDSSVGIRFSKWRSLFAGFFSDEASICDGPPLEDRVIQKGHEPNALAGVAPADAAAIARDEQRKEDIQALTAAMVDNFCENGEWPAEESVESALVPAHIDALPTDPSSGEDYLSYVSRGGFIFGATLEDAADPYGPTYTLGTIPSMMLNASFEDGSGTPSKWSTSDGASATRTDTEPRFADNATAVELTGSGALYQLVVFDFSLETPYTAAIYARSESGSDQEVEFHMIATFADGRREDPFASTNAILPASGAWTRVEVQFDTPPGSRISVLQFLVKARAGGTADIALDGATVLEGTISPSLPLVSNVDPATLVPSDLPKFSDSPIIGVGPRKDNQSGAYDNEYALFLDRYGLLGTTPYVALWVFALWRSYRAFTGRQGDWEVLGLALACFTLALMVFNVAAGSFYNFQLMAIFWILIGLVVARSEAADG